MKSELLRMFTFESHATSRMEVKNLIFNFLFIFQVVKRELFVFFCFVFLFVPSSPHTNSQAQVHIQTHKPDRTKININGFDMAKCAAQLLYGPVLVCESSVSDVQEKVL